MKKLILLFSAFISFNFLSAQNPGDSLFLSPTIHTIKIFFSQVGWWDSLVAYKPLDKKMLADVEVDGVYYDSVGVQFKGNSSYNAPGNKKPFKIDFNEFVQGQKIDGIKTINLNNAMGDPTLLREKTFLDVCRAAGIEAPRATYTNLYLNNQLWGFYVLVEQVNKDFLETHYGNNGGNLFKGDANGTLQWYGTAQSSYYGKYELKTNETLNDWSDLVHLIDEINNTPSQDFYDSLEVVLNTQEWIDGWAMNIIFSNLDSYVGSGHNYYIYHNNDSLYKKFDFILWDSNEAYGKFNMGMNIAQLESLSMSFIPNPATSRPITNKMLANSTYLNMYVNTVCQLVTKYFSNEYLDPKIDSLVTIIRPYVYADPNKPYTNQNFEDNINTNVGNAPGIKSFITNRRNSLSAQLAAYGCFLGINDEELNSKVDIYPNPFLEKTTMHIKDSNFQNQDLQLTIYDVFGKAVIQSVIPSGARNLPIERNNLPSGMYFYQLLSEGKIAASGKMMAE